MHASLSHPPLRRQGCLAALLLLAFAACDNGTGPSAPELAKIQLSDSLVVLLDADSAGVEATLLDQNGAPMQQLPEGTVLRWTSLDTTIATVQGGMVKAWRPGQTEIVAEAGTVRASARVRVEPVTPTFTAVAGDGQGAARGEPLEKRLEVRVLDVHGRPVRDAAVEFVATAGGGTFTPALQRTDSAGIASASWTLGAVLGEQKAEARLVGQTVAPLPFTARGLRQIAFVSSRDGNAEIYLMNEDGSRQRNRTNNLATDRLPVWSPDGTKILFVSSRDGGLKLYVMNADGSAPTRLTGHTVSVGSNSLYHNGSTYAWSRDGSKIVFESGDDIYLVNADGSNLRNVTDPLSGSQPTLSPDGTQVAFIRRANPISQPCHGQYWLYVMNVDGSNLRQLAYRDCDLLYEPRWSPDGTTILYGWQFRLRAPAMIAVKPDGTGGRQLLPGGVGSHVASTWPVWSPDGRMLAYVYTNGWTDFPGNEMEQRIRVANADGTPRWQGTQGLNTGYTVEGQPAWSADGTKVAYVRTTLRYAPSSSEIWVAPIDGSSQATPLSSQPGKDDSPAWRP